MAETGIAVMDYGGQYVENIARAFAEMAIPVRIMPPDSEPGRLEDFRGIVLSGGPYSVYEPDSPTLDVDILESGKPILGLCYGFQLIAHLMGGEVRGGRSGEYGFAEVEVQTANPLFRGMTSPQICWMSHGDEVVELPDDFVSSASTRSCPNAAIHHRERPIFGLQFHPEVSHTPEGWGILRNFASEVCGFTIGSWDTDSCLDSKIGWLRDQTGDGRVLVAVSGGVDSTVAAALTKRAVGDRLVTIHIDQGLMREGESEWVVSKLKEAGLDPVFIDESDIFLGQLAGVSEGDAKRKVIGELFIRTFERFASEQEIDALIQGTIAPDAIESLRGQASEGDSSNHGGMIKLHHNVGGLPEEMWIRVLEPLRDLFKYQVRLLGNALGVPETLLERQPFPGPALAVRISGEVTKEKLQTLRSATSIVENALLDLNPSQYLVYLIGEESTPRPDVESTCSRMIGPSIELNAQCFDDIAVGVKGDERLLGEIVSIDLGESAESIWESMEWLDILRLQSAITGGVPEICRVLIRLTGSDEGQFGAVIRSVESRDFMTAIPSRIPFPSLFDMGSRLVELPSIKHAYYEITTKPPSTIEFE